MDSVGYIYLYLKATAFLSYAIGLALVIFAIVSTVFGPSADDSHVTILGRFMPRNMVMLDPEGVTAGGLSLESACMICGLGLMLVSYAVVWTITRRNEAARKS